MMFIIFVINVKQINSYYEKLNNRIVDFSNGWFYGL